MQTKEAIYEQLLVLMDELYEVEPAQVRPEALLGDDLDIDSIDAVDMAARLQQLTGHKLEPAAFREIRTVQNLIDAVSLMAHSNVQSGNQVRQLLEKAVDGDSSARGAALVFAHTRELETRLLIQVMKSEQDAVAKVIGRENVERMLAAINK